MGTANYLIERRNVGNTIKYIERSRQTHLL